jgi:RNA methyltransferase, TrmH family
MTPGAVRPQARAVERHTDADPGREPGDCRAPRANAIVRAFQHARASDELVVLEGFHPLKHALRFGAQVETIMIHDIAQLSRLVEQHAPELASAIFARSQEVSRRDFKRLGPYEPHTGVVSIARKVGYDVAALLAGAGSAPVVLLDDPRHRGNFGAVVRVAAAAGTAGVLSVGAQDPWHPVVVRGAAGLHFALPVARLDSLAQLQCERALLAFDPAGEPLDPLRVPSRSVLAFGSERRGISPALLARADARLSLSMRPGVSSLNLATAVAAVLYGLELAQAPRQRPPGSD